MPLVASTDYPNKRIYLGIDSVGVDVLPIDIYKELRAERRTNSAKRSFYPMIRAFGNDPAGPTNTPRFTVLENGVRIVPYDGSHTLAIRGALISTSEGLAGPDLFDRTSLGVGVEVNVDYQPPQVEIIQAGSGLDATQAAMLLDLFQRMGLDSANPVTFTPSAITFGGKTVALSGDGTSSKTATRQP